MISLNESKLNLNFFFKGMFYKSVSTYFLGWGCVLFLLIYVNNCCSLLAHKAPSVTVAVLLGLIYFIHLLIGAMAYYVRSHKQEPFMIISVFGSLAFLVSIFIGRTHGVEGVLYMCVVSGVVSLLWAFNVFNSFYKRESLS